MQSPTEFLSNRIQKLPLAALSGILLGISYPGFNLYCFEWIAFVPLLIAIENTSGRTAYLLGTTTGFFGISIGFHWVADFAEIVLHIPFPLHHVGAAGHSFAVAQVFGFIFFLFQKIRTEFSSTEIFLFPILYVSLFPLAPIIFKFTLGDAQSYFPVATQAIEFTGVYGLDCIILLTNILVYRLLFSSQKRPNTFTVGISLVMLGLWFGVGQHQLRVWDRKTEGWTTKRIGLVQTNRQATLEYVTPQTPYSRIFPKEIARSRKLLPEKPEIIIWPEGNFFGYSIWDKVRDAFRTHVAEMGVPIIFHDITRKFDGDRNSTFNSTILIDEKGLFQDQYDKMIRVPFGEYTPLTEYIPFIEKLLGEYLSNLAKGEHHTTFVAAGMKLTPVICYEALFPEFVAESIQQSPKGKVIVVQSQDGWYGRSSASEQHLTSSSLRAVENRVPLIHAINNGRSGVILPTGRYVFISDFFQEGEWVVSMPYDPNSGGSFYSDHPHLLINIVRFLLFLFTAVYGYRRRNSRAVA